jgi:TatD DNase family protein
MKLIDTHSHIYAEEFDADRAEALARARAEGVGKLLLPAIDAESDERMFDLARAEAGYCYAMMGLHPTSVNDNPRWREEWHRVERYFAAPPAGVEFCAVGEIGLDYYWSEDFKAEQREAFVEQCRLAVRLDLPVVIHTRSAWDDMCDILEAETARAKESGGRLRGVLHAFSEDATTYCRLRACGDFVFGIGGVVTFKKSSVAAAVEQMALEDIVLETDCPYLAPVPVRGKTNHSGYLHYTAAKAASLLHIDYDEFCELEVRNAKTLFGIA